ASFPTDAVTALVPELKSSSPNSQYARLALERIGYRAIGAVSRAALRGEADLRSGALLMLGSLAAEMDEPGCCEAFSKGASDPDPAIRLATVAGLTAWGKNLGRPQYVDANQSPQQRHVSATRAADFPLWQLCRALHDDDPRVRVAAAKSFATELPIPEALVP